MNDINEQTGDGDIRTWFRSHEKTCDERRKRIDERLDKAFSHIGHLDTQMSAVSTNIETMKENNTALGARFEKMTEDVGTIRSESTGNKRSIAVLLVLSAAVATAVVGELVHKLMF